MLTKLNSTTKKETRRRTTVSCWRLLLFLLIAILFVPAIVLSSPPQACAAAPQKNKAPVDWRVKRRALDRQLADELQDLADWCRKVGLNDQVGPTFDLYQVRDLDRQYIFMPSEKSLLTPDQVQPKPVEGDLATWLLKVNEVKRAHAANILELAKEAADAKAGAVAFQLLHEVIYFDRDHEQVRKILGHKKTPEGWNVYSDRIKLRTASKRHPVLGWAAKTYFVAKTPHFEISSNATKKQTLELAENLERWHYVWRQVYFDYWSNSGAVRKWLKGDGGLRMPTKKFEIAFFKDLDNYVGSLSQWVKGVEGSSGYYKPDMKLSFFPAGDDARTTDTWRHELNHQLLRETIRCRESPFADGYLWLDEGMAMYFESLTDFGEYFTLGGFESRRLQFARLLRLRQGVHVGISELAGMTQAEFQARPDRPNVYTQSAGISHMLMDDNHGMLRPAVIDFMKMIHKSKVKPGAFEKRLGKTFKQLDDQHLEFLAVDADQVIRFLTHPKQRTELAIPNADLQEDAFAKIGQCHELTWLDVTGSTVSAANIALLKDCDQLTQLFLTNCSIDPSALVQLKKLKRLEEIDFTNSSIEDEQLASLDVVENLSVLRLAHTGIGDRGLEELSRLKNLEVVELTGCPVSQQGIAKFSKARPKVKVVK
jgi:hypothetical protein